MSGSSVMQKQQQKNLRNLMKLGPNKRCADCGEQCAVQVDTTNSIFLCSVCSGIHRDFGFRIKSVSMAVFTQEEITKLQSTNNDEFNKVWMGKWKQSEDPFPTNDDANYNNRSQFLRKKYVDKVWLSKKASAPQAKPQTAEVNQAPPPAQPQNIFGFDAPASQPQQKTQTNPSSSWSPFGNQPVAQGQPQAPKNDLDDLLNFGPPTPSPQQAQAAASRNDIKDLLGALGPGTPAQPQGPQASVMRQGGFSGPNQGGFGGQNTGAFGGQKPLNQGGFGAPQNQGGFGGPQNQGGFGSHQNQGGFGGQQNQGGFGMPQNQGGFGGQRPQNQGGFGGPQNQGGFGGNPNQGGFGGNPNQGGFGGPQNQGGFGMSQNQGGFGGQRPQNQGGFGAQQNQGGFGGNPNQGGFGGNPNQGGFGGNPNQGGFGGNQNQGGFGGSQNQPSSNQGIFF